MYVFENLLTKIPQVWTISAALKFGLAVWFALAYKAEVTSESRPQKTIHTLKLSSAHEGGPGLVCWRAEFPNQLPDMHLRLFERHLKPPQTFKTPAHLSADCRQTNKPSPGQNSGHRDLWAITHAYCLKLLSYGLIRYAATMDVLSWSNSCNVLLP